MAKSYEPPDDEQFEIRDLVRHATPQVMAISGPQFSGKTFGAILLASGLVEPGEMIGAIDTENGRFAAYADDADVKRVIPQGIKAIELHPPFHPKRFINANRQLERMGCKLIITDSGSHAWDGEGGGQDMKEEDRGWKNAKLWTRRFSAMLQYSSAHQIVCLRAQDKTKIIGEGRDQKYIPLGVAPICEKNFYFSLATAFMVEGSIDNAPATHLARPTRWPKAMNSLFANWTPQLLTPEIGAKIREWNNSGAKESPFDRICKKSYASAMDGEAVYVKFFDSMKPNVQKVLEDSGVHTTNLATARRIDSVLEQEQADQSAEV